MVRPFLRYPVNHHLAQILERAVAIAAVRAGPLLAEAGLFNGDEPERPGQWPRVGGRFGDSWSGRLTARSGPGSRSGQLRAGPFARAPAWGGDRPGQVERWPAGWTRRIGGHPAYALLEWARTSEADGFFVFHSVLAEGAWSSGPPSSPVPVRADRAPGGGADRPVSLPAAPPGELDSGHDALDDPHGGVRGRGAPAPGLEVRPLVEVAYARVAKVGGGLFDVERVVRRRPLVARAGGAAQRRRRDAPHGPLRRRG